MKIGCLHVVLGVLGVFPKNWSFFGGYTPWHTQTSLKSPRDCMEGFLPLIMAFCEQILGLWGKTEPCRDLLFHTSMAKEVGMWPSEFTQHE